MDSDQGRSGATKSASARLSGMEQAMTDSLQRRLEQLQVIYELASAVGRADASEEIHRRAIEGLIQALRADRAAVLLMDANGVMRFRAWRGLSDGYRKQVEGHSPWQHDEPDPKPITIDDVHTSEDLGELRRVVLEEGIAALAFIPLLSSRHLLGKFMVYFDRPHQFTDQEIQLAQVIAGHVAFALERWQAEQYRARLAAIVESSDDAIVTKNVDGIITSFNPGAERLFGYKSDEIVGKHISILLPAGCGDQFSWIMEQLRNGKRIDHFETVRRRKDGTLIDVSVTISPLRDAGGRVVGASKIARDITWQKRAERAVRASEERFRHLVHSLPAAVYTCDAEGRVTMYNRAAAELWGREPQINKDTWCGSWRIYRPDGTPVPLDQCPMAVSLREARAIHSEELIIERPDGSRRHVLVHPEPIFDTSRTLVGAVNMLVDITERKHAEEALRQSEQRFRAMAEAVPSIFWIADADGTITYANQRWYEYTGITPEQNARDWPRLVLHPDDYDRCLNEWNRALRQGSEYSIEVRNRRADGEYRWFVTRAVPNKDEHGKIISWFGATTDIHELKQLQAALKEADQRKDDFLAMLGHELRNPLAPIRNAVEILGSDDPAQRHWAQEVIDRQSRQLVRLVDDLLDVSRISRGKITLRRQRMDLVDAVHHAVEACRPLIAEREQVLEVALVSQPFLVDADPARVTQIVQNLLHNATKFTPAGGRIHIALQTDGNEARISVRDTGRGIAPHMLQRIFEPFTQADGATDGAAGGLGIGLALVRTLAELHGGSVQARSDGLGKGAEFIVHLPVISAVPEVGNNDRLAAGASRAQPDMVPCRVLVVDDHEDSARSMSRLLKLWGHNVQIANDGLRAIDLARQFRPDVVLLDIGLPVMNGYDVARALRDGANGRATLLVAMTGYGQDDDRQRAIEAGFDFHLTKPIDLPSLQHLLITHGRCEATAV